MEELVVKAWIRQIRSVLPKNARIEMDHGSDIILRIDWRLLGDPRRPNKRSRLVAIVIPEETIRECNDFKAAGSRLLGFVKSKLSTFNENHDTPRCGRRPVEKWVISTHDIN
jgi:hypothetical protein